METPVTAALRAVALVPGAAVKRCLDLKPSQRASMAASRSPGPFFVRVFAQSTPFWLLGLATDAQLMPGLSVSALMALCPMAAALMLVDRERKTGDEKELLLRSLDWRRIKAKRWYAPLLLLMPFIDVMVYGSMRWMGWLWSSGTSCPCC